MYGLGWAIECATRYDLVAVLCGLAAEYYRILSCYVPMKHGTVCDCEYMTVSVIVSTWLCDCEYMTVTVTTWEDDCPR